MSGCSLVAIAACQWRAYLLHPAGASESAAVGVNATEVVGSANVGGVSRAVVWRTNGPAIEYLSNVESGASNLGGSTSIGGAIRVNGVFHAAYWPNSTAQPVDLMPKSTTFSSVSAISGSMQVGRYGIGAALWSGTPNSIVILTPVGATTAEALGTDGKYQVGSAKFGTFQDFPILWQGSKESAINLTSPGATGGVAWDVDNDMQVGVQNFTTGGPKAGIWHGTPQSFRSLDPYPTLSTQVYAIDNGTQIGYWIDRNGIRRPSLWTGTPQSWQDLFCYLPDGVDLADAYDVSVDGKATRICGRVRINGVYQAVLWVSEPVQERVAASFSVIEGHLYQGNVISLRASDDDWVIVGPVVAGKSARVTLQFNQVAPLGTIPYFGITVDGHLNSTFNDRALVYAFNFLTNNWDLVRDAVPGRFYDAPVYARIDSPAQYIHPVTRKVSARISFVHGNAETDWSAWVDRATWSFLAQ